MAEHDLIDLYLLELQQELAVPRRLRRRVLIEAADHLTCAAAERGVVAAVRDFGDPALVARRFVEELALGGARRAAAAVAVVVAVFCAFFGVSTQIAAVRAVSPFGGDPAGAIGWLAAQLAFVCGGLSVIRLLRHRRAVALPAGTLRYLNRSSGTALAAVAVSLVADLAAFATGDGSPYLLAALLLVVATTAAGAVTVIRAHHRLAALAGVADVPAPAGEDALDDVRALAGALPGVDALRRHPWRLTASLGLAAGTALAFTHAVGEGLPNGGLAPALLVGAVFVGIEAAAVALCFATFGRYLGIHRPGS